MPLAQDIDVIAMLDLIEAVRQRVSAGGREPRLVIGIAGPPAAGKTTLAEAVVAMINARDDFAAAALPMDGFHLDNRVLRANGLLDRKGAPETFDILGFRHTLARLREEREDVVHPIFDRERDLAVAGGGLISRSARTIVAEGNYLLLASGLWRTVLPYFDATVFIEPPLEELERRLVERWRRHGYAPEAALARARNVDLVNARLVLEQSAPATLRLYGCWPEAGGPRDGALRRGT